MLRAGMPAKDASIRRYSMGNGFIHEKLDIQILIMYILERLPGPVDGTVLSDLTLFDGGFNWFDYTDCLAELIRTGHITETDGRYELTEKGRRNVGLVGESLPYSVRVKADRLTAPVAASMRRSNMIETVTETGENGLPMVCLRLSDGVGEIVSMRLAVPDEEQAKKIEKRFRDNAEDIYNEIIHLLTEE
jgi:hypothetical protein